MSPNQLPPHSLEAEMCLIASMMIDPAFAQEIIPTLNGDSFFLTDNRIIFDAIADLTQQGRPVDAIILRDELKRRDVLDRIGGAAYIAEILQAVPSAAHGPEYAARVREHAARRQLIGLADNLRRRAMSGEVDAAQLAGEVANLAGSVMSERTAGEIIPFSEAVERAYDGLGEGARPLIKTGLRDLDAIIGGIGAGETCVLAARPSMGKSTLARSVAKNVASSGIPVGFISLEEGPEKIARNALAGASEIDNHRLRSDQLGQADWDRLGDAVVALSKLPIFISRTARTVDQIHAVATTMKSKHGCRLLVIDHLSRVRAPGKSRYEVVTNASGAISDTIKDLGVAGLVLCQLNRGVEHRDDQRPSMSDLRDSGAIEEDADTVLLLHREDYFRSGDASYIQTGVAEIIIAKNRDSVRGSVARIKSELRFQRFIDLPPGSQYAHSPEDF